MNMMTRSVRVPAADDMDDETFGKHFNKRHGFPNLKAIIFVDKALRTYHYWQHSKDPDKFDHTHKESTS